MMPDLFRATVLIICALSQTAGCAMLQGERFGLLGYYAGSNDIYRKVIYDISGYQWSDSPYLFVDQIPLKSGKVLFGEASSYFPDNQKKIPDKVTLLWLSAPNSAAYSQSDRAIIDALPKASDSAVSEKSLHPYPHPPKVYGPYEIAIRSKIPEKILSLAASGNFGVGITIEFAETHQKVYWRLEDYRDQKKFNPNRWICVGGQSIETNSNQKLFTVSSPEDAIQKTIPIWPHCKLP